MAIRWDKSATTPLSEAVANFNRKINKIRSEENKDILPGNLNYYEVKESIKNRDELYRYIKSLKKFQAEGSEQIVTLESGRQLTEWEYKELKQLRKNAKTRITKKLNSIDKVSHPLPFKQQWDLIDLAHSLDKLETATGKQFERIRARINLRGRSDYELKKAIIFRENYIKEMEKYKGYANYNLLKDKMESIKDPLAFYNQIKENDLIVDLQYQSDEHYNQSRFNQFVIEWGVNEDTIEDSIEKPLKTDIYKYTKGRKKRLSKKTGKTYK